ncbi:DNA topoisomerase VI, B subunit [Aciduliprofundum sp. MAR08-339]|uniref:DNA topoisomerase VI subunit B n=1 Tax=Aciduliprofundum sp. (strain MAR08-339) TaxID=673860 RepID=UPI0002A4A0C7|nr:DNA topoisomerase VI, B subunit [Aciduliprofundum sp. MAR08-339]
MGIAHKMARKQREISVAEFFEKNKQILGFDSLTKALVVSVKEAVDNALDACEEAQILPDIYVEIDQMGRDEYRIVVEDNGPGIIRRNIPLVFGKLLYGSRFHAIRQSRGQQGIGISAVVLYGQLTTGKPARVVSKISEEEVAYEVILSIDTKKNAPRIIKESPLLWDREHGTRIEVVIRARYVRGKQSVYEYLQQTAIVNPHAQITFVEPDGKRTIFKRATDKLPPPTREIKPHPHGIELGELLNMARNTKAYRLTSFLTTEFSRVSPKVAEEICKKAYLYGEMRPQELSIEEAKRLLDAFRKVKLMAPPTDCLSPIGETLIKKGLKNVLGSLRPSFYAQPVTREPKVYSGNPFIVEAGMVYGGELPKDQPVRILRFANRVPLLYQQGADVITKAIGSVDWRRYGLEQRGGQGIPVGPAIILVHVASTRVPFTSEAKEAIAEVPEIREEIELALKALGRQLRLYNVKKQRKSKMTEKFFLVTKILPEIARKSAEIVEKPVPKLEPVISKIMNVVWIDEEIVKEDARIRVNVKVANYTSRALHFTLYGDYPLGNLVDTDGIAEEDYVKWEVNIAPVSYRHLYFVLEDADRYGETNYYVDGINPNIVIGAEPLPGDWNIKLSEIEEIVEEDDVEEEDLEDEFEEEVRE